MEEYRNVLKQVRRITGLALVLGLFLAVITMLRYGIISVPEFSRGTEDIEVAEADSTVYGTEDPESGLLIDRGFEVVKMQCGSCHSAKLVAQNRFSREGWTEVIRWMQREQKLWDLGEDEAVILDYLEKNQAPKVAGRRKRLENIDWYVLNE